MSLEDVYIERIPTVSRIVEEKIWIETDGRVYPPIPSLLGPAFTVEDMGVADVWLTVTSSSGDVSLVQIESQTHGAPSPLVSAEDVANLGERPPVSSTHSSEGNGEDVENSTECQPYLWSLLQELDPRIPQKALSEMVVLYTSAVSSTQLRSATSSLELFKAMIADGALSNRNVVLLQALLWRCELPKLFHRVAEVLRQREAKPGVKLTFLCVPDMAPRDGYRYVHFNVATVSLARDMSDQLEGFRQQLVRLLGVPGEWVLLEGTLPSQIAWLTFLLANTAFLALELAVRSRDDVASWLSAVGVRHVSFQQSTPPFAPVQDVPQGLPKMSSEDEKADPNEEQDVTSDSGEETPSTPPKSMNDADREIRDARRRIQQLAGEGKWMELDQALRELPDRVIACLGYLVLPYSMDTTVLHVAIKGGYSVLLRLALQQPGICVDARDRRGNTPLLMAVKNGISALIVLLQCLLDLELVADMNAANKNGRTALHEAARHGDGLVLKTLLKFAEDNDVQLDVAARDKRNHVPLHFAAQDADTLAALLDYSRRNHLQAELGAASDDGETPLHAAARCGLTAVKILLQHAVDTGETVDVAARGKYGVSPLHLACTRRTKMLKTLLRYSRSQELYVDINVQDVDGDTPMHIAVMEGNSEAVQLLKQFILTEPKPVLDLQEALMAETANLVSEWVLKPASSAFSLLRFPWRSDPAPPDPQGGKAPPDPEGEKKTGDATEPAAVGKEAEEGEEGVFKGLPSTIFKRNRWGKTPVDVATELSQWAKDPPKDHRLPRSIERKVWMRAVRGDSL